MDQNREDRPRMPTANTQYHAMSLALKEDKPIMLDYWSDSVEGSCLIGIKDNNEKLLVKSEEEYTSPITKIFKVESEYIIITENSIYITHEKVKTRRIS